MSTIEINRVDDLREGDYVTLRWEFVDGATVTLEGPMWNRMVGAYAVTDARFVSATREMPDDIEALRRSLEVAREGYRKEAAAWRARDTRMGAEVERLEAEVERWKAEAEMLTAKVDRLMPLQEHENECAYRQRTEKAESEVERLRAARQVPTRKQIVDAMWPDAPESARAGMTELDIVDRIVELFEQGDKRVTEVIF